MEGQRATRILTLPAGKRRVFAMSDSPREIVASFWNYPGAAGAIGADANMPEPLIRDGDLLKRFREGDHDAFTLLYRAHQNAVFRFAMFMTGDHARAADVTQDVFVWLIHHAGNFDPARGELGAFLAGVARKFLQKRRGDELRWVQLDESMLAADRGDYRERRDDGAGDADELRRAILALPEKYREVVVRCDLEEKSYEEAAVVIGCAVGTVRSRLHRARGLLARKLEKQTGKRTEKCPV
jgi:RNA polymerase sigma-70 factor (ECF subfamily)